MIRVPKAGITCIAMNTTESECDMEYTVGLRRRVGFGVFIQSGFNLDSKSGFKIWIHFLFNFDTFPNIHKIHTS
jgi:hypothetical protein